MRLTRAKYSDCDNCPLKEERKVWGKGGDNPKIVFIGEAPGRVEQQFGEPFVGPSGKWLDRALSSTGISRSRNYFTNIICCRPPKNNITSFEATEALKCCRPGLVYELEELRKRGVKVFVPLGNTALLAFPITETISKCRGSVYHIDNYIVIPTYHPSYIMKGQSQETVTWYNDFKKVDNASRGLIKRTQERFNLFPSLGDIEDFRDSVLKSGVSIGVDIETTGFNLDYADIIVVGLASSGSTAISIPFFKKGMKAYWPSVEEEQAAREMLGEILKKAPTIFQNAMFDIQHLRNHGFIVGNLVDDTMLAHHALHPELPHNLGYITSIYGSTPYWKGPVLKNADSMKDIDDKTLRTYNLRDACVLKQIMPGLAEDLRDSQTEKIYRNISIKLVDPLLRMMETGVKIDKRVLGNYRSSLKRRETKLLKTIREVWTIDENFNFSSSADLNYLLYGKLPAKYDRAKKELEKPLKTNTKKYSELIKTVSVIENTKPFRKTMFSPGTTSSGNYSTDANALLRYSIAINNRLEAMKRLIQRKKSHNIEEKELNAMLVVLDSLRNLKETEKLLSTYTVFSIRSDGRLHGNFLIHGTANGRLSSRSPNLQNIPWKTEKLGRAFVPEQGNVFIEIDYSNLELRVLAYLSKDDKLINTFKEGRNVHSDNTKILFGIDETDPMWKSARRAAKTYIFGRNYGGTLRGIFERIVESVPELQLTFSHFKELDNNYRKAHPKSTEWAEKTQQTVVATRTLRNAFGRVRIFLGNKPIMGKDEGVKRAGLNFPIQSTAADIINMALINIYDKYKDDKDLKILFQIHDSLIFEAPKKKARVYAKDLKKLMEAPVEIEGERVSFPVDVNIGTTLYSEDMKEEHETIQ